jgi:aminoglycoside phosphotransferase (APT) family kinase protein
MERSERHAADLARRVPEVATEVQMLMTRLRGSLTLLQHRDLRPVHGAPSATQWLAAGGRLGLVDFDRFAAGDPELDVGILLADLDFERLPLHTARAIAGAIIDGWTAKAGPLDYHLVQFYRSHRHLDKALRRASAIRADGDRRASASLRRSVELLASSWNEGTSRFVTA